MRQVLQCPEKGWGESLATVPSPASWDSAAGRIGQPMSGLPYGRGALSLVQSLEARSFGRLEKRSALDQARTCVSWEPEFCAMVASGP